jgi:hypothetical protein
VVSIEHYSVQEYLESDRIRQQKTALFSMSSAASNLEITQMCLVYLLDPMLSEVKASQATLDKLPLAEYAAKYWYEHIKGSKAFSAHICSYVIRLFNDQNYVFCNRINIYDHDNPFDSPFQAKRQQVASNVYYAALLGFDFVLSELIRTRTEQLLLIGGHIETMYKKNLYINAQGGRCGNALQAASAEGHEKVVQLLLDKTADLNAQGGYYGNALQAASAEGHEKVVQQLLNKSGGQ